MATVPTDLPVTYFTARDGVRLACRSLGEGRPLLLIHGYFSNAFTNWIRYGHARLLAEAGHRVVMPDLRGHGDSDTPQDAAAYPPDALVNDGFDLLAHLGIDPAGGAYDLAGYSLGGRTAIRMLAKGARPGRAIITGMGLAGILHTGGRGAYFRHVLTNLGTFKRGSSEWMTEAFLKTTKGDPQALLHTLDTFVDTPCEALAAIDLPLLVVAGEDDDDNGSGQALADAVQDGRYQSIPGNHMSAVTRPELGAAIAGFLQI